MRRILLAELRHSLVLKTAPLLVTAYGLLMWSDASWWRYSISDASAAVTAPLLFLAPVLGALTAWQLVRRQRLLPQPPVAQIGTLLAARLIVAVTVIAAMTAFAALVHARVAGQVEAPWWGYIVIAVAVAAEAVTVGVLLGVVGGPVWFAPAITVMSLFLRLGMTQGAPTGSAQSAWSRVFLSGSPSVVLTPLGVVAAVIEALLAIALAVTGPLVLRRWRQRREHTAYPLSAGDRRGLIAGVLVAVVALAGIVAAPPMTQDRAPVPPVCTTGAVRLCVWPEQQSRLSDLMALASATEAVMARHGVTGPIDLSESGLPMAADGNFVLGGPENWFLTGSLGDVLSARLLHPTCVPNDTTDPVDASAYHLAVQNVSALIQLEIMRSGRPSGSGSSSAVDWDEIERVAAASPSEQQEWLAMQQDVVRSFTDGDCA